MSYLSSVSRVDENFPVKENFAELSYDIVIQPFFGDYSLGAG